MRLEVKPGKYVVAVSGGVDSVVLLDVLRAHTGLELVVAHFDHGIRPDSAEDATFVRSLAERYELPFVNERVELGPRASEATARQARYDFLRRARDQVSADAIITAHHQDDVLETAIINMLRGTGRRGLTSLQSTAELVRPLLDVPKTDILTYAAQQKLSWHEDSTNHDERYTRNYIRKQLLVRFDASARQQLLALIRAQQATNTELDAHLADLLVAGGDELPRRWFASLPHDVSKEVMASWLRAHGLADFDRQTLERLVVQVKTKPAGRRLDVFNGWQLVLSSSAMELSAA